MFCKNLADLEKLYTKVNTSILSNKIDELKSFSEHVDKIFDFSHSCYYHQLVNIFSKITFDFHIENLLKFRTTSSSYKEYYEKCLANIKTKECAIKCIRDKVYSKHIMPLYKKFYDQTQVKNFLQKSILICSAIKIKSDHYHFTDKYAIYILSMSKNNIYTKNILLNLLKKLINNYTPNTNLYTDALYWLIDASAPILCKNDMSLLKKRTCREYHYYINNYENGYYVKNEYILNTVIESLFLMYVKKNKYNKISAYLFRHKNIILRLVDKHIDMIVESKTLETSSDKLFLLNMIVGLTKTLETFNKIKYFFSEKVHLLPNIQINPNFGSNYMAASYIDMEDSLRINDCFECLFDDDFIEHLILLFKKTKDSYVRNNIKNKLDIILIINRKCNYTSPHIDHILDCVNETIDLIDLCKCDTKLQFNLTI